MEDAWVKILASVLSAAVSVALGVGIYYLRAWAVKALPERERKAIEEIILKLVRAAEQSMKGATNDEKRQWVLDQARTWLVAQKLPFDPGIVMVFIEAAVGALNDQYWKPPLVQITGVQNTGTVN